MPLDIRPTTPADMPAVAAFLADVYQSGPDALFVQPTMLRWKYYEPHPAWAGSRSYVMKEEQRIVAHGCACPVTFLVPGGEVRGTSVNDWAAERVRPGAGVLLMRKIGELVEFLMAVGGSEQTLAILPRIGFSCCGEVASYARVLRPWRQFRAYPHRNWKSPLRLVRNTLWSFSALASPPGDWSARPVPQFDPEISPLLASARARSFTPAKRTPELLNYMLRCPGAAFSGFLLYAGRALRGYFVLSRVGKQSRIADLLLDSDAPEHWRAGVALAARCAGQDPQACELIASATVPLLGQALVDNGFRLRSRQPLFLRDPKGVLGKAAPLNIQFLDGDACYLEDVHHPFLT